MRRATLGAALAGVAALAVAAPAPARAGSSCSSGGSSGGSSSGSSSDSSSSDSGYSDSGYSDSDSGSSGGAPMCVNSSEIVGRSECTRFAAWDSAWLPRLTIGVGTSFHTMALSGRGFSGTAAHETDISYRLVGDSMERGAVATAVTLDTRITGNIGRHLYVGVEGSFGGGGLVGAGPQATAEGLRLDPRHAIYFAGGAIAGVGVPLGDNLLRAEALLGARSLGLSVESQYGDCVSTSTAFDTELIFQPRLSLSRWLSPWVTAGASLGSHRRGDVSVGLFLEGHLRAYDGNRTRTD